jgi:hypothetical protein
LGDAWVSVFVSVDVDALPFDFFAFFDFFIFLLFFAPDGVVVSDFVSVVFDVDASDEDEPCAKALVAASAKAANNVAIVRTIWPPWGMVWPDLSGQRYRSTQSPCRMNRGKVPQRHRESRCERGYRDNLPSGFAPRRVPRLVNERPRTSPRDRAWARRAGSAPLVTRTP